MKKKYLAAILGIMMATASVTACGAIVKDDLVASSCRVFFCLFCRKESEVEFITHIFLRFSGSDTAASWSDYEVEKPDTL